MKRIFTIVTLCIVSASLLLAKNVKKEKQEDVWAGMQTVLNGIKLPDIPDKDFVITQYGASQDSSYLWNGKAINRTIEEASKAGGGMVVIPQGEWKTGPLTLLSHINLHVEKDAKLLFSTTREHYLPVVLTRWEGIDCYTLHPLIYAYDQSDIAITGEGTIDGQANNENWWHMCGAERFGYREGMLTQRAKNHGRPKLTEYEQTNTPVEERKMTIADGLRAQMVNIYKCDRVLIEGVTMRNSPFWVMHPMMVNSLTVRDVKVISHGPNSDGCDPESCNGVLIERCYFDTGDDCIAIKSGRNNDGRRWGIPSQNIIVRDCHMKNGHGGVVVGSEISGGYRNLWVENCKMDSPELERVIRIKTNPCRGGVIENIYARNIEVGQCKEAVLKINLDYEPKEDCQRDFNPVVRNVRLENVTSKASKYGVCIIGLSEEENVYDISVKDCHFDGVKEGDKVKGMVKNLTYDKYYRNGEKVKTEKKK